MGTKKNKKESSKSSILLIALITIAIIGVIGTILWTVDTAILQPSGVIAAKERQLIIFTTLLGSTVVVPVLVMLFVVAWRYREGNTKATYSPNLEGHRGLEAIWWGVPLAIIAVLGVVTWQSSHELDPYKPLDSSVKPITVQVVALQWRWLFIYPDEKIASLNEVRFPVGTPINFVITADAPMNSFWIPKLGGQVYAMSGMSTKLHLQADEIGDFEGSSANISGQGFAGMRFTAKAVSSSDYIQWLETTRHSGAELDHTSYLQVAAPSKDHDPAYYVLRQPDLYDTIIMKYMDMGTH